MSLADERVGQLLDGKYRLQALLATGGMGHVYAAEHQATGRAVAVKLLRWELMTQPDLVRRVSAEARLAVEASHPNVVDVLDAGADGSGLPYLVLERLYGQPLEALIGEKLSLLQTAQALVPVMNALETLHRAGIVHRDIKPSNIFLSQTSDGRMTPKLLDFGIAKALEHHGSTLSGVALGTPAYMAPEQALGRSFIGPGSDVWSMGVVFVRCLTGHLPFAEESLGRTTLRTSLRAMDLPEVSEPIAALLSQALQFEPSDRPHSMHDFRSALLSGLRKTDPSISWPNELTVGYGPTECRLARVSIESLPPPDSSGHGRARPPHLSTRTLDKVRTIVGSTRMQRLALPAIGLTAVTSLGAVAYGLMSALSPPALQDESALITRPGAGPSDINTEVTFALTPNPPGQSLPTALDPVAVESVDATEQRAAADGQAAEAPSAGGSALEGAGDPANADGRRRDGRRPSRSDSHAQAAPPAPRAKPEARAPTDESSGRASPPRDPQALSENTGSSAHRVGANRSPIIE
jgi:serine/threonine protein kinase